MGIRHPLVRLEPGASWGGHRPEGAPPGGGNLPACPGGTATAHQSVWTESPSTALASGDGPRGDTVQVTRRPHPFPGGRGSRPQEKDETAEGLGRSPWEGVSSCGRPGTQFRSAESSPAARGSLTPGEGRPEAADPSGDSSRLPRAIWAATESREADTDVRKAGGPRPTGEAARRAAGGGLPWSASHRLASCWVTALRLAPLACGPCALLSGVPAGVAAPKSRDEGGVGGALYTKQLRTGRLPSITPARMQSVLSDSLRPQGSSMGFSRQEGWSGLLCPPPGGLPDPGIEPGSLNVSCRVLS